MTFFGRSELSHSSHLSRINFNCFCVSTAAVQPKVPTGSNRANALPFDSFGLGISRAGTSKDSMMTSFAAAVFFILTTGRLEAVLGVGACEPVRGEIVDG